MCSGLFLIRTSITDAGTVHSSRSAAIAAKTQIVSTDAAKRSIKTTSTFVFFLLFCFFSVGFVRPVARAATVIPDTAVTQLEW